MEAFTFKLSQMAIGVLLLLKMIQSGSLRFTIIKTKGKSPGKKRTESSSKPWHYGQLECPLGKQPFTQQL